jgi:hypothetical protein
MRAWRAAVAVAALLVAWAAAQGLWDRVSFEPTSDAIFREYVGGRLLTYAAAAGVVIVLAVAARAGTRRTSVGVVLLVVAVGVLVAGEADARHRLRYVDRSRMPDLLAGYPAPAGGRETDLTSSGPEQARTWSVPGDDVCATARAAFLAWAGPGAKAESGVCSASGRHGEVVLTFDARPGGGGTTQVVVEARPSYGT